jgi:hypothetical protein
MYDYYLGGKDNFRVDREAAEKIIGILPNVRDVARENRDYLVRVVSHLSGQGIRQFLDIGAGLPTQRNVHQVAQELAPDSRVVYVDNDPIVLTHARAILEENKNVIAVGADMRAPQAVLDDPKVTGHLDFAEPVAILLLGVLHFIPDDDEAMNIVDVFKAGLGPGGFLVVSHGSLGELTDRQRREGHQVISKTSVPGATSRSHAQVLAFFDGLDLVEPGVVPLQEWHSQSQVGVAVPGQAGALGGVGRMR